MKIKHCPNCRKSGRSMLVWRVICPGTAYHVECPSCNYCGKKRRWIWLAVLSWNRIKRDKL